VPQLADDPADNARYELSGGGNIGRSKLELRGHYRKGEPWSWDMHGLIAEQESGTRFGRFRTPASRSQLSRNTDGLNTFAKTTALNPSSSGMT
jgi:hypothetical protein